MIRMFPFDLLGSIEVPGMRAEVRKFHRTSSYQQVLESTHNVLSLHLGPSATVSTRKASQRSDEFTPYGPLAYRARSSAWEFRSNGRPTLAVLALLDDDDLLRRLACELDACCVPDVAMGELMRLLHQEIRSPGFGGPTVVESIGEILRIRLCRHAQGRSEAGEATPLGQRELCLIRDCLETQRGRAPAVSELAKLCGMSSRSLLRRFKAATGDTVAAYVADVQLAKAKRLLASSNLSMKQIAYESGFSASSNFTAAFKRHIGLTPSEYRAIAQGD